MKKSIVILMVLICAVAVFAQGTEEKKSTVVMKYATTGTETHPLSIGIADAWLKPYDEACDGVEIKYYYNGELGTVNQCLESIALGEPLIVNTDASSFGAYAPDIDIVTGPFLFEDAEDYALVTKTKWWQEQCDILYSKGYKVLNADLIFGTRYVMSDAPVRKPADLAGKKIRIPNNQISIAMMNSMGGVATPLDFSEVYSALAQGVINGSENPPATLKDSKVYEVSKYLSKTAHQTFCTVTVTSVKVWESLSKEEQDLLIQMGEEAASAYNTGLGKQLDDEAMEFFKNNGVTVVEDVDVQAFMDACTPMYSTITKWTPGLLERVRSEVAALKK